MNILAIDTATEACSAALYINGEVTTQYQLAPREHSRLILKMIDSLLLEANLSVNRLDAIAFGQGPGSFMGLRIAAGVVQGISFAHDIPVIPISTLKTIAQLAFERTKNKNILVAIDARMDEVYWGAYFLNDVHLHKPAMSEQQWCIDGEECVISPDKVNLSEMLTKQNKIWVAAGSGWGCYADRLLKANNFTIQSMLVDFFPAASAIVTLAVDELKAGNTVSAAEAIPVYLRNDVAKKPKPVRL